MADTCPTVQIVSDDPEHGGFIVINEADFDKSKHKLYVPKVSKKAAEAPATDEGKE